MQLMPPSRSAATAVLLLGLAGPLQGEAGGFVSLVPRTELSEHWIVEGSGANTWSLRDGVIVCTGNPNGFLWSKKTYRDFIFRAEWRFRKEGWRAKPPKYPNAGFFIHAGAVQRDWPTSLEVQGHYGEAGSLFGVRGGRVTGAHRGPVDENREPFGEWERIEIQSRDGVVTVKLNGKKMNEGRDIHPAQGSICLQSEGWPVDYRKVEIQELGN